LDNDYQHRLAGGIADYQASRATKLRRGHVKLAYFEVLESAARWLGIGIKRRATLFSGQGLAVVYPEPTSLAVSRYGFYEEGLTKMVLEYLNPGMTFLDVGAHIGYFTLLASWRVGGLAKAAKSILSSLHPALSRYFGNVGQIDNVHLNQTAVASGAGTATVHDFGAAYSGYSSMFCARMKEGELSRVEVTQFQASSIFIDQYVAQKTLTPNFVKIDAESTEFDILKGMVQTITRYRPIISVEVGNMDIDGVIPCRDLALHLIDKGYAAYEFHGGQIVEHQVRERYEYDNILFLPKA
jgi:FkbM family methyltransferase